MFSVLNEFNGMKGVLAMDAAVFKDDQLVAFVEIDGESHYKQVGAARLARIATASLLTEILSITLSLIKTSGEKVCH